ALADRYRIEREIGQGGMATVFLARDLKHDRQVAIKVLKPELAAVIGAERFLAEIKTTANLQHPHILPLHDSGEADGFLFYVMPYVEGESLRDRLDREHQIPVDDAVKIATNLAEALDYAHRKGVIHRDIKPANVLLLDGKPVIADFGIALAVGAAGGGRLTETGLSLGTPHYMSPEQATGDAHVGPATDIYALGCVLYETLVGEPPYTGSTPQAVLGRIITGTPDPVTEHRKTVPANVEATVDRALEKVPADRFPNAAEFARALADPAFRHGEPARAGATSRPQSRLTIGLVAVAVLLGLAAAWGWLRGPTTGPPPLPLQAALLFPADSGPAIGSWLALSPDGARLAFTSTRELDGGRIWIQTLENGRRVPLAGTEGAEAPSWSPEGDRIAFGLPDREIRVIPADGGLVTTVARLAAGVGVPHWGVDGRILFMADGGIWSVSASGGTPTLTVEMDRGPWASVITTLPDGRRFLVGGLGRQSSGIFLGDLTTGEHRLLVEGAAHPKYVDGWLIFRRSDATMVAQRFDPASGTLTGPMIPLANRISTQGGEKQFDVSRNMLVYLPRPADRDSWALWAERDGRTTPGPFSSQGTVWMHALSRDGSRIASGGFGLWVADSEGELPRRIDGAGNRAFYPRWSEDASRVMYDALDGLQAIETEAGSAPALIVSAETGSTYRPVGWGPAGEVLFIQNFPDGSSALRVLDEGGAGEIRTVLEDATQAFLSPDGQWIAYASGRDGQVSVRAYRGTDEVRISEDGGVAPSWGPAGDEVFFVTPTGQAMVSSLRFDGGVRASIPTALPLGVSLGAGATVFLAAHPDGRLLFAPGRPARESVSVLRDWQSLEDRE
ncbi:MAG: protein kinase, partial [Gemmatimonadota bacterium]